MHVNNNETIQGYMNQMLTLLNSTFLEFKIEQAMVFLLPICRILTRYVAYDVILYTINRRVGEDFQWSDVVHDIKSM